MNHRIASAWPTGWALTATLATVSFLTVMSFGSPEVFAQSKPPARNAQKGASQPAAKPPAPAAAQQQPAQPAQPAPQVQLMYSPWVKLCQKGPDTNNKEVCIVTKDGRLEDGRPVAIVQLFEPEGADKILRVTVPLGMQLQHGTRVIIDQNQPMQSPYKICFPVGCMSDYPVTDDLINSLKKGQAIRVQAINMQGTPIDLPMPLNDFAKAYDGPPTDLKVFEEQQRKLQQELAKKAEEARQKLEAQQGQVASPANKK
jgi:invasion protein IalB